MSRNTYANANMDKLSPNGWYCVGCKVRVIPFYGKSRPVCYCGRETTSGAGLEEQARRHKDAHRDQFRKTLIAIKERKKRTNDNVIEESKEVPTLIESQSALAESQSALAQSQSALAESKSALAESQSALIESKSALAESKSTNLNIPEVTKKQPFGLDLSSVYSITAITDYVVEGIADNADIIKALTELKIKVKILKDQKRDIIELKDEIEDLFTN